MTRVPDALLAHRGEFPILNRSRYLISNSLGAMPRGAAAALAEYAETWASRGVRAWSEGWWEMSVTVGDEIAPLIGAAPRYAAREGPRLLRQAGVGAIRQKSMRQTSRLLALADARGFATATPRAEARRGGTVAVEFENAREVSRELNARDVLVDYRPGVGIRLLPHFYTEEAELDRAFEVLDEIRASGAWRRWQQAPALVT